jgi:threonine dehydrogenase-like Zn-dependent dehydrogenase
MSSRPEQADAFSSRLLLSERVGLRSGGTPACIQHVQPSPGFGELRHNAARNPTLLKCHRGTYAPVKAFRIQDGQLAAIEKPLPELLPNWALIKVRLAGICNTDVEILRGYHDFHGIPGHEFVGEVIKVGDGGHATPAIKQQQTRWIGRRVTGDINVSCSAYGYKPVCEFCLRGLKTHCARRTVLGIVNHDGAFAEYLTLPVENLHEVPSTVPDEQSVFVEPLAAACQILDQIDVKQFTSAAVLGDGKLAQLVARVLKTEIPRVVMYGKYTAKLELVNATGSGGTEKVPRKARVETEKVSGTDADLKKVKENFALVVEATGSPTGLALAQQITEPRGTLVLKSTFHGATPIETWPIVVKEITVVGSRCGPFAKAIRLLREPKVDPRPLITRTFPLDEAAAAIAYAQEKNVMKVLLKP